MTLYKNKETRAKLRNTSRVYLLKVYYLAQFEDAPEKEGKNRSGLVKLPYNQL